MRRRLDALRLALAPLGSRSAISNRVLLFFFPVATASQLSADAARYGGSIALWSLAGIAGFAVLCLGFAVARRLLPDGDPAPRLVFLVFALAGLGRSLTVGLIAVALDLLPTLDVAYRVAGGLVYAPTLLGVVAYAVSRHDAHAALVAELEGRTDALSSVERELDAARVRVEGQLAGAVRASIDPALQALDVALGQAAAGGSSSTALAALTHLLEDEVRPLSHRLAGEVPIAAAEPSPVARSAPVPLPRRFRVGDGIRPLLAAFLATAAATASALRDLEPLAVPASLGGIFATVTVMLVLVRRVLGSTSLPTPLAVASVVAIHAVAGYVTLPLLSAAGLTTARGIQLTGTVITALVGLMTIATPLVDAGRSRTEADLAMTVERLQRSVERMRRRRWLAQRRLAHVLHGNIQGSLYAAAMRLAEAGDAGPAVIDGVRDQIREALDRLDPATGTATGGSGALRATVDELAATWGDRRSITTCVTPEAEAVLASDGDADEAVALVVREAVVNALRHGRAHAIGISVDADRAGPDGSDRIEVRVRDDGAGWAAGTSAGLGSALFEALCAEWGYSAGEGTSFTATLVRS